MIKKLFTTLAILALCFNAYALDTGDLNVKGKITLAGQLTSTLALGTSPFSITSTTVNTNLNADLWDGYQFADYLNQAVKTTSSPTFATPTLTGITIGANTLTTIEWAFLDGIAGYVYRAGGTDVAVADGGTNLSSYAVGDILYASGTTTIGKLADVATGSVLVSGGVGVAPAYSASPVLTDNLKFKTSVVATGHKEGVTTNVSTESNLTSAALAYGFIQRTQDSPSTIYVSIANGVKGQMVTIQLIAKAAGDYVITDDYVGPGIVTKTGWDDITFDTAGDSVTLLYFDDTVGWIVTGNNGVVITQ